ncbi:MAG: PLP-dependent transferase [Acidimicrobiia bacterium]|nr:PLP-dependent transferase [Acidimicrobiia bacterium]
MSHTSAIHGDDHLAQGPDVAPPIRVSTTFDRTHQSDLVYRRDHHLTTRRLEAVIGALEGGFAVAYSSGMAATAAAISHISPSRVSLPEDLYGGTRAFARREEQRGRLKIVDPSQLGEGDLMWVETPSNPKCFVADIAAAANAAHGVGALVVVDSTFATPVLQQPLSLGADFSMHSTTKFIGGHSDSMGGALVVKAESQAEQLKDDRSLDGSVPGALDAWLALRGIRTLPIRMERQSATAQVVADFLSGRVAATHYPGLAGHPGADIAKRQMSTNGAMVSFEMDSFDEATRVRDKMRIFHNATSLGGVESVADLRRDTDPSAPEGLIRLSIGLEDAADLVTDLEQALG